MPAAAIITAVAAVYSASEQRKAGKEARKAAKMERRIAEAENVRSRRQAIRERVIQAARLENQAAGTGSAQSSGVQGGIASLGSQTAANIGFSTQIEALNNQRLSFLDAAAAAQGRAQMAATVSSVASSFSPGGSFYSAGTTTQPAIAGATKNASAGPG